MQPSGDGFADAASGRAAHASATSSSATSSATAVKAARGSRPRPLGQIGARRSSITSSASMPWVVACPATEGSCGPNRPRSDFDRLLSSLSVVALLILVAALVWLAGMLFTNYLLFRAFDHFPSDYDFDQQMSWVIGVAFFPIGLLYLGFLWSASVARNQNRGLGQRPSPQPKKLSPKQEIERLERESAEIDAALRRIRGEQTELDRRQRS